MLLAFYNTLFERFGTQHWWPGDSPWEIACGAILTQNTNWGNVEKAIDKLKAHHALDPKTIQDLNDGDVAALIRSAGYFNLKTKRLKALARWWTAHAKWAAQRDVGAHEVRKSLLSVNGVGPETADSITLYAFEKPVFVVDAYTKRVLVRHGLAAEDWDYHRIQQEFETVLDQDVPLFNEYHALIVRLGKDYCRPTPRCENCPLQPFLP